MARERDYVLWKTQQDAKLPSYGRPIHPFFTHTLRPHDLPSLSDAIPPPSSIFTGTPSFPFQVLNIFVFECVTLVLVFVYVKLMHWSHLK